MKIVKLLAVFVASVCMVGVAQAQYTDGFYIVNEDWYGHNNSTINFFRPDDANGDYWEYRVFQQANQGHELGATSCVGVIHCGKMYIVSKQEKDPGASVVGGRMTVCDAKTMEMEAQLTDLDPQGGRADGRSFIGITPTKGYVSTSNGVYIMDLRTNQIKRRVPGTENPNGTDDLPNSNPMSALYYGQCGSMVLAGNYAFVAHQEYGCLVVDINTDKVIETISMDIVSPGAGIGSVVKAKDGTIWCSVAANINGMGETLPYLVEVDPITLMATVHTLPEGIDAPANSWYAWTPDGFCTSRVRNALYWNGGANSWFSQSNVYRYDIDTDTYEKIIDLSAQGDGWSLYGCSMRLHPQTDELYLSLFVQFVNTTYRLRRCDYMGNTLQEYPMIANYWFPSIPVFPEEESSGIEGVVTEFEPQKPCYYDLQGRYLGTDPTALPRGVLIRRQNGQSTKFINK